jgi:hypothetical protein
MAAGAVVARLLIAPRLLREMDFVARVTQYRDHDGVPGPASARAEPWVRTVTLSVQGGAWETVEDPGPGRLGPTGGGGVWWESHEARTVVEHLDPALFLAFLCDFSAEAAGELVRLRAKPRPRTCDHDSCRVVDCDADDWLATLDWHLGVLADVETRSEAWGGLRSTLDWLSTPSQREH